MAWFARLLEPWQLKRQAQSELRRRMDQALERGRQETKALAEEGAILAERIRRNTKTGRSLLGGSRPL